MTACNKTIFHRRVAASCVRPFGHLGSCSDRRIGQTEHRVMVGCINWNQPVGVPRAISYVLRDGEMTAEVYHPTWQQAMNRATELAKLPTEAQQALMSSMTVEYDRAMERLGTELDRIAPDGIDSTEWLEMVNHALGKDVASWYADWIGEAWEPVAAGTEGFDRLLAKVRADTVRSVATFVSERFQYGAKLLNPTDEDLAGDARVRALVGVVEEIANRIERGDPGTAPIHSRPEGDDRG